MKHVRTVSPIFSFADTLVDFLLTQSAGSPEQLAKTVVLLPTRRGCLTLRNAFLNATKGKASLLPRILSFGDLDDEETQWSFFTAGETEISPALDETRRRFLLTRLIAGKDNAGIDKAYLLAGDLCALLDEAALYGLSAEKLANIVPENLAEHWQKVLDFLKIVLNNWPAVLESEQSLDAAERRRRVFTRQVDLWRATPPDFPIIAAGSTGSQPATALLLDAIASLDNGLVVLPGFDTTLDKNAVLPETHPQYHMKQLIDTMGLSPADVCEMTGKNTDENATERLRLIREAMAPAETTEKWRSLASFHQNAVAGVTRIDADNEAQEALIIALILRQTLETPEKTAAVVTPNRLLAQRIIGQMKRWGVDTDDSAGIPLAHTPLGIFLELTANAALTQFSPVDLLAFLKHPLTTLGKALGTANAVARQLEKNHLRGLQYGHGIDCLRQAVKNDTVLSSFADDLATRFGTFYALMTSGEKHPVGTFLTAHLNAAESLAQSDDKTGAQRLWKGDAGDICTTFLTHLNTQSDVLDDVSSAEYAALFHAFLSEISVRPRYGMHPRIDILGTMEARLIRPDVLILAGLNEGSWPKAAQTDAWFSRPMRAQCGLPLPEHRIGLAAHDFTQGFCSKTVFLTRALKEDGTATVPSRWLSRLETLMTMNGLSFETGDWKTWAQALDAPDTNIVFAPPAPKPPVSARPRQLSVTQIETLMRDPYSIYAREVLRLKPMEDLDKRPDAADFGTAIHAALDDFCKRHGAHVSPGDRDDLLMTGRAEIDKLPYTADQKLFFFPAMERALNAFFDAYLTQAKDIAAVYCEQKGALSFETPAGTFTLTGRADRIDTLKDNTARIVDYKTGVIPKRKDVEAGYSPQLPLEAYMLKEGAFPTIAAHPSSVSLSYCAVSPATGNKKTLTDFKDDGLPERIGDALKQLIASYDDVAKAYDATPDESLKPRYTDYDHLARYREWSSPADDEQTEEQND